MPRSRASPLRLPGTWRGSHRHPGVSLIVFGGLGYRRVGRRHCGKPRDTKVQVCRLPDSSPTSYEQGISGSVLKPGSIGPGDQSLARWDSATIQ